MDMENLALSGSNQRIEETILPFSTEVSIGNIIDCLLGRLDKEDLAQFVIALDKATESWDFTEDLYKYFADIYKQYLLLDP
jgi:hypothetical protein